MFVVSSQAHQLVSFRGPPGGNYPEFGKMSAKSIHRCRALTDEKVAGPVNHQHALLLFGFDRHKAHSRSLNSLAAGLRVGGIMFVGFDVGSDIASRHQSGVMTDLRQLTRPEMRSAASFEADKARWNIGEETQHLASSKLSSENRPAIGVDAMHLEPSFRRIKSDRCNRHRTTPCFVRCSSTGVRGPSIPLSPVHAQLSRRRRSARRAWAGCLVRNGAAMGVEIRADVRPRTPPQTPAPNVAVALR